MRSDELVSGAGLSDVCQQLTSARPNPVAAAKPVIVAASEGLNKRITTYRLRLKIWVIHKAS